MVQTAPESDPSATLADGATNNDDMASGATDYDDEFDAFLDWIQPPTEEVEDASIQSTTHSDKSSIEYPKTTSTSIVTTDQKGIPLTSVNSINNKAVMSSQNHVEFVSDLGKGKIPDLPSMTRILSKKEMEADQDGCRDRQVRRDEENQLVQKHTRGASFVKNQQKATRSNEFQRTSKSRKYSKFNIFAIYLPTFFALWYAAAILFPPEAREGWTRYFLWTDGELTQNDNGEPTICPRPTICSEGLAQLILISLARLSAFASYVCLGLTFVSKMHSTIHFLSNTYIMTFIPLESLHKIHAKQGLIYVSFAVIHTITHVIRWGLRQELGDPSSGLSVVGISGYFAISLMLLVVFSMSLAKRIKMMKFEHRLNAHWLFIGLAAALCFHTKRSRQITLSFTFLWLFDYLYGMVFRTHRLDIVEFSALPDGSGAQMLWRNPEGFNPQSGEFVRIQIPWLEGGKQWHPFSLYLNEATEEGLREIARKEAGRIFLGNDARGGRGVNSSKTAIILVECQNEFCSPGGKLHDDVKGVMNSNGMLNNLSDLTDVARMIGAQVLHAPIIFNADMSNNPNNVLGILKDCRDNEVFIRDSWGADFVTALAPKAGDCIVKEKCGLDCFPGSNLEQLLTEKGIETVIIGGFLTNCCVESTIRTAYEKGLNVISLIDGTACRSEAEQMMSTTTTFRMFSTPMTCEQAASALRGETPKGMEASVGVQREIVPATIDSHANEEMTLLEFMEYVLTVKPLQASEMSLTMKEARQDLRNRYSTTQVFIAAAGDWTRGLYDDLENGKQQRACWVRGPYTSPYFVANEFNHLILFASGIGVTPALGVMGQYPGASRTKILVWLLKSRDMLKFFAPLLKDAHMALVFYTGKEKLTQVELQNLKAHGNIYIQQSRPKSIEETLSRIITQVVNASNSASNSCKHPARTVKEINALDRKAWCILYCGGSTMIKDKLKTFAKDTGTGFQSEVFDW